MGFRQGMPIFCGHLLTSGRPGIALSRGFHPLKPVKNFPSSEFDAEERESLLGGRWRTIAFTVQHQGHQDKATRHEPGREQVDFHKPMSGATE